MANLQEKAHELFAIWTDDSVDEATIRERSLALRQGLLVSHPEEQYGTVLMGATRLLIEYRQAMYDVHDITSEDFND